MRKHNMWKMFTFVIMMMFCIITGLEVVNADAPVLVKVEELEESYSAGDDVSYTIKLRNADKKVFSAIVFEIEYDKTKLSYIDTLADRTFTKKGFKFLDAPDSGGSGNIATVSYAISQLELNPVVIEDSALAVINFEVLEDIDASESIKIKGLEVVNDTTGNNDLENLGVTTEEIPVDKSKVKLEKSSYELDMFGTKIGKIKVNYKPENTTDLKKLSFKSSDDNVVTVDNEGNLEAKGNGTATITVKAFGKTMAAEVKVVTSITGITLDASSFTLDKDGTRTLKATIVPGSTTMSKEITWTSSDPSVALVDSAGKVTALKGGTAIITAKTANGKEAKATVTVIVPLTGAKLEEDFITLNKGVTKNLKVLFEPVGAFTDDITWTSSDSSVASVDNTGKVTALKGGTAIITANVGGFKVTATVNVVVPITSFKVSKENVTLVPGASEVITTTIEPSDFTGSKIVSWLSNNPSIAKVDNNGKITAVGVGTTTITATIQGETKEITVKVLKAIDSFDISDKNIKMAVGGKHILTVTILPFGAEEDTTVTWTSSDSNVATVSSTGEVQAVGAGTAKITGTLKNGMKVDCDVTVYIGVDTFKVDKTDIKVNKGNNETVTATITPTNATYQDITWEVKDITIATVRKDGNKVIITGEKNGSTKVIGTLSDGKTVTINVTVIIPITDIVLSDIKVSLDLNKKEEKTIGLTINPSDTTEDKTAVWKSTNEDVATVDATGHIVAKGIGNTTITVTVGKITKEVTVNVVAPIESFTIEKATEKVLRNATVQLKTTINPEVTTEDKTITWTSSDPRIATVDNTGKVMGLKKGTVTITGTLSNGMSVDCVVTVETIEVEKIYFDTAELAIARTHNQTLKYNVYPLNATELDNVIWTSDNEEVATVDEFGNVKTLKNGTANITVKLGEKVASIKVVVSDIKLKGFSVKNDGNLKVGDSINIELVKDPIDATEEVTFIYKSLNEEIVKVDETGKVTAVGVGSTTIEITASNGTKFTYSVKVDGKGSPITEAKSAVIYGISSIVCLVGMLLAVIKLKKC